MTEDETMPEGMSEGGIDGTLRDAIVALSALPAVSEADVQRIVARAAAGGSADVVPLQPRRRWFGAMPLAAAAGLVLAAGIGGFVLRGVTEGRDAPAAAVATTAAGSGIPAGAPTVSQVAGNSRLEAPIATQFVLDAPAAARVSVVGAFNSWDAAATPLQRDAISGLWTVTLPLAPGRHVYAFMVNDTALTLDPRAPVTRDPELGTTGSVILVGTP